MSRKVVQSILALASVVVYVCAVPGVVVVSCDANGDRAVDVCDLQAVIKAVLQGAGGTAAADANGDGSVDIRDFQVILQQAQASKAPPPASQEQREQAVIVMSRGQEPGLPAPFRQQALITLGKRVATAALQARSVPVPVFSAKEERYYYRLTPNAPPAKGMCVC